ncbi:MAG: hypothetical protein HQL12_05635 [Candidatus Omnitrophica bacterium]|nr:hypothetical protein [Candidatus Omnitrophota bacterium]
MIPKEVGNVFRIAMIPEFPSLFIGNSGDSFEDSYSCDDFTVNVYTTKAELKEVGLSVQDLGAIDSRLQHSIGNWLMNIKARGGNDTIKGSLKTLAKDIYAGRPVRDNDYKNLAVNLKSLKAFQYSVSIESGKGKGNYSIHLIHELVYNDKRRSFIVTLPENLSPRVANEIKGEKELGLYISITVRDIYPRQKRYEYKMRQYLAGIKKSSQNIKRTKGDTLLEQFGYLAYCKQFKEKYRNKDAEYWMQKYIEVALDCGVKVNCVEGTGPSIDTRKKYYFTNTRISSENRKISEEEKKELVDELANFIKKTSKKLHPDINTCINEAKRLIERYSYQEVKEAFEMDVKPYPGNTIDDLRAILSGESPAKLLEDTPVV